MEWRMAAEDEDEPWRPPFVPRRPCDAVAFLNFGVSLVGGARRHMRQQQALEGGGTERIPKLRSYLSLSASEMQQAWGETPKFFRAKAHPSVDIIHEGGGDPLHNWTDRSTDVLTSWCQQKRGKKAEGLTD